MSNIHCQVFIHVKRVAYGKKQSAESVTWIITHSLSHILWHQKLCIVCPILWHRILKWCALESGDSAPWIFFTASSRAYLAPFSFFFPLFKFHTVTTGTDWCCHLDSGKEPMAQPSSRVFAPSLQTPQWQRETMSECYYENNLPFFVSRKSPTLRTSACFNS